MDLPNLPSIITFVQDEIVRQNGRRLAAAHQQRQQNLLTSKHEPFTGAVVAEQQDFLINQLKQIVNALSLIHI